MMGHHLGTRSNTSILPAITHLQIDKMDLCNTHPLTDNIFKHRKKCKTQHRLTMMVDLTNHIFQTLSLST